MARCPRSRGVTRWGRSLSVVQAQLSCLGDKQARMWPAECCKKTSVIGPKSRHVQCLSEVVVQARVRDCSVTRDWHRRERERESCAGLGWAGGRRGLVAGAQSEWQGWTAAHEDIYFRTMAYGAVWVFHQGKKDARNSPPRPAVWQLVCLLESRPNFDSGRGTDGPRDAGARWRGVHPSPGLRGGPRRLPRRGG